VFDLVLVELCKVMSERRGLRLMFLRGRMDFTLRGKDSLLGLRD
jgi:hypothetical protein